MSHIFRHFRWSHLWVFLGFYAAFAALTFAALNGQSESDRGWPRLAASAYRGGAAVGGRG